MLSGDFEVVMAIAIYGPEKGLIELRRAIEDCDKEMTLRLMQRGFTAEAAKKEIDALQSRKMLIAALERAEKKHAADTN